MVRIAVVAIGDFTYGQFGDQRRVTGEYSDVAVLGGDFDLLGDVADYEFLGSDDFDLERVRHRRLQVLGFCLTPRA